MARKTCQIIRKSVFTLLQNYEYFTSTPTLLAFPYAASYLLTQSLVTSSRLFVLINGRLKSIFIAAGYPSSSRILSTLNQKLSETATTFLFVSPLAFTFLLLARASVIIHRRKPSLSWSSLFISLLITQLCNTLLTLAANATCFSLFALCFSILDSLNLSSSSRGPTTMLLSAASAVIYNVAVANAYIVCNLASVPSGMESRAGLFSIAKACFVIWQGRGRATTALSLAVAMNLGFAGIEGLFQYRVVRAYPSSGLLVVAEGVLIGFLYALLLVLDIIVGCVFWRSCCKKDEHLFDLEEENYFHYIEIADNKLRL